MLRATVTGSVWATRRLDALPGGALLEVQTDDGATPGVVRVARGAVTERTVEKAAKAGARLVLGRGAVLTPLAREKARARGIEIERERRC